MSEEFEGEGFEERPYHTTHPDFMSWLLGTTALDLQIRADEVDRQLHAIRDHEHRHFPTLYATLQHITLELNFRANRIVTRRGPLWRRP